MFVCVCSTHGGGGRGRLIQKWRYRVEEKERGTERRDDCWHNFRIIGAAQKLSIILGIIGQSAGIIMHGPCVVGNY